MNNCDMTRMAHMRVQKMDPENASMIVGYYLLRDNRDRELVISLAFGPDSVFQSLVANAQLDLGLLPSSLHSHPHLAPPSNNDCSVDPMYLPSLSPHSQSHLQLELQSQLLSELQSQLQPHTPYTNLCRGAGPAWSPYPQDLPECPSLAFSKLLPFCAAEQVLGEEPDQIGLMGNNNNNNNSNYNSFSSNPFIHPDQIYAGLNYGLGGGSGISSLGDPSLDSVTSAHKPCSYYARGFCKHGTSCKFLHIPMRFDPSSPHGSSQSQGQGQSQSRSQNQTQREIYNEDGLSSGSLERLEMELQNLLRGRRSPVSIASLPQLYYERYGKTLQAEGYLTESQRHGKAGYSLTKLLARLKNTVTLIDRPHGQHAVVLAEDAQKFISFRESEDQCGINPGSRQIYLTFPAESTFSEDDVSEHFKAYGPVQDVRIPYQQKRMFGFVTFVYSETVKAILSKGNPHYICGSRVLVKPYKEKGKQIEKKIVDRGEQSRYSSKAGLEIRELEFSPGLKLYNGGDPLFRDYEEQNQALLALDRRRLQQLQLQLVMEPHSQYPQETHLHHISLSNGYNPVLSGESTRIPEDLNNLQSSSALGYLLDVLDSDTGEVQVPPRHKSNSISHSDEHNLPESPFASPPMHAAATPLSNQLKALTLASSHDSDFSRFSTISLRCIICQGLMADPIQLECTHTFCIQCILEVIGVSRDECPLCRRNIGNQIVKLLENRGFPVIIDPSRGGGS